MTDLTAAITEIFNKKTVVIVGDMVADQFLYGSISRVSREAPVFILQHQNTETRPGGAANAAANVATLGGHPVIVGVTGNDENGRLLRASLNEVGVDCKYLSENAGGATTTKVRVLASQSYSVKQQVIRIDYENSLRFPAELESKLINDLRLAAENADAIIVSDYDCGVVTDKLFEEARTIAEARDIPVVVDSRSRLRELRGATTATPNQDEATQLLGTGFTDADCARLCSELGLKSLLLTCGNKGMTLVEPGKSPVQFSAVGATEPVDVTGAGDTVIAAYALGLASGMSFRDAALVANHAGGIVVMKKGTATASQEELIDSLAAGETLSLSDTAA
jgi:rfaE bifunctional protein kinase chain/domain